MFKIPTFINLNDLTYYYVSSPAVTDFERKISNVSQPKFTGCCESKNSYNSSNTFLLRTT